MAASVGLVWFSRTNSSISADSFAPQETNASNAASQPLDQISSADIAVNLARLGRFEEVYWLAEQAAAVEYLSEIPASSEPIAEKPQVVNSTIRTLKDISTYVAVEGDTVSSVATKYGVSTDSIRWSNGISGDSLDSGDELTIPPQGLDGIVYTVKEDDTIDSLAKKYEVNLSKLISFNDVESGELTSGSQIFLIGGKQPVVRAPIVAAATQRPLVNGSVTPGYTPIYGSNGYVYGHCTYYLATRANVPSRMGNANRWDDNAESRGYVKSKTPVAGAIAQTDRGFYGHVAYVEAVSEDGSMIKYSDMNGVGGWNRVYYSGWVPATEFTWYLY